MSAPLRLVPRQQRRAIARDTPGMLIYRGTACACVRLASAQDQCLASYAVVTREGRPWGRSGGMRGSDGMWCGQRRAARGRAAP